MKTEHIVKKSGLSYFEFIYCLLIFINLFVLCQQIFYNINVQNNIVGKSQLQSYETIMLRIESHLKEVTMVEVEENYLHYEYRNYLYYYTVYNDKLILTFNSIQYILLEDIKEVKFYLKDYFIEIIITNSMNKSYFAQVLYYDKK